MWRRTIDPRQDWQKKVESQGLYYHSLDGVPYWDERAYYEFRPAEIDEIEAATYTLDKLCLAAVEHVIQADRFQEFDIPPLYRDFIRRSWEEDEHTLVGRFDLSYDGHAPPKLLEYNADTPTALLEAAVVQWFWLQERFPGKQQFNSLHERLLEAFQQLRAEHEECFYFTAVHGELEDYITVNYLRDVAIQAGFATEYLDIEDLGWNSGRQVFTDLRENAVRLCFKLYPWEWMQREQFGPHLRETACRWFEPPWKALLSNKAILPVLWELNPGHPNLLPAAFEPLPEGNYVRKPIFGREGANVQIFQHGQLQLETAGPYDGPVIYQQTWHLPCFQERHFPLVGSWIINGWAAGIGIREDESLITGNSSRFLPHVFGD